MIEIIASSIILTLTAYGILATISMLRPQSSDSDAKLKAAYEAKQFIESLRSEVWNYAPGTYTNTVDGYAISWTITDDPSGARGLTVSVPF